jgi:hypothetical protein
VGFFFIILFDFGQEFLTIALTFAGDELDILGVYDTSFAEHNSKFWVKKIIEFL